MSLNLSKKYTLIKEEERNANITIEVLSEKYGWGKSTIYEILKKQKDQIVKQFSNGQFRHSAKRFIESSSFKRAWRSSADVSFGRPTLGLSSKSNSHFLNLENHSLIVVKPTESPHKIGISFHWPLMVSYQDYRQTKYNGECVHFLSSFWNVETINIYF